MSARSRPASGRLRRDRRDDPDDPQTQRRAERRSEQAVEQARAGNDQRAAQQPEAETLQTGREDRAGQQRADQPERGRVRRGRPAPQQKRTEASSEECTKCKARERERAHDEPPPEAEPRQQRREGDDQPVQRRHPGIRRSRPSFRPPVCARRLTRACSTVPRREHSPVGSIVNATSASEHAGAPGAARLHGEHRRRQRAMRARPVIALAAVAFVIGAIVGAGSRLRTRHRRSPAASSPRGRRGTT